jgi:hypothetical protein
VGEEQADRVPMRSSFRKMGDPDTNSVRYEHRT